MGGTVVIGKNSFLAQGLKNSNAAKNWTFLSHDDIGEESSDIASADTVVNFSFSPSFYQAHYDAALDVDSRIAGMLGPNTKFIMLSSRMVYGQQDNKIEYSEDDECQPAAVYGQNKLIIERKLQSMPVASNLTILRLSNIFGYEPSRSTFFGTALTNLYKKKEITFDIAGDTKRDFLPLTAFARQLVKIINAPKAGIYNLGAGFGVTCAQVSEWMIAGYGQGRVVFTSDSRKGEFVLNMDKTNCAFDLSPVTLEDIKDACVECGRKLRAMDDAPENGTKNPIS